ncbi:uncharacterized protein KIAA2012 isoform X1 [Amphiprion ocellaris]|uniref:uncharacterized protein KIAA2012 isoform X1 n=2 Tax=Amphiprion ocellaris TaxID=80972 RepID=UPI0024115375|nr:uncharacterized protein KIAA2012 isoform X1 [Amphiprion ocellaris]XP_054871408.1 uncharacterized protein KIAA2012 isoform X1 [Amphiprion ocellaris]
MQDPPLSRLSRGCGRLVSSNGRLDVCFTPQQDYYIWRDQDSLLRLSNSLMGTESTLPKTYSTRRGALLLYSQHLVSMESSRRPGNRNRKQRAARRCCQQVEQQLSMLKDPTAAVLNHSSNQFFSSRPPVLPPLNLPAASRTLNTKHQQLGPERNTKQPENQSEDKDGQLSTRRRVRLDLDLQIPRTSRTPRTSGTPTPQMEPHPCGQPVGLTPEEPERPQISINMKHHSTGELHDRNKNNTGHQAADGGRQDDRGSCGRSMSGSRCGRTIRRAAEQPSNSEFEPNSTSGLVLPPLNAGSCRQNSVMSTLEVVGANGHPSTEIQTVGSGHQDDQPQTGEAEILLQENPKRCNQQPHFLPLLFPGRDEDLSGDKQREGKVKPEKRRVKTEAAERRRGRWFSSDGGSVVLLQPGDDSCLPPEPSGSVAGRRGPGRQSSLAFLQNLQNLCEPSDTNRDVVKGVLPLQLRDVQSSRSVGSLILGPDGEIIRLSLFNNNQDQTEALQVVSTDGQEFPWFILLQPQHTLPEAEEELNTDDPVGDIQQHQSVQKQLLDVLGSPEMDSSSSCTDSGTNSAVAFIRNKSNLNPRENNNGSDGKNLLMEQRGGNTEEEEDDEEEQSSSEHSSHLPASPGSGQIMNFPEAAAEEEEKPPVDQTKKRQNPENVAVATGKKNAKMVKSAESDKQKTRRKEKRKQKTESDDQSKQEETTNQEEETLDRSVLPSVKKKMREGLRGDLKMKEEEEESAERRKRRLRRRERSTELHVVIPEAAPQKEDPKATSDFKSSSATKHENTNSEKLSDLSANHSIPNNPSNVQSARSLRSVSNQRSLRRSAASSCDWPTAAAGVTSSHGRLSSCSTVMVMEEQLMLNPVKPESSRFRQSQEMKMEEEEMKMKMEVEDAAALHLSQQAERKRQEVERKRREKEEEERKRREEEEEERKRREEEEEERKRREEEEEERKRREKEEEERKRREEEERKQQMEERMKMELQEERKRRTEELRLKKLEEEEEERRRKMEEEQHRVRREEEQRGRERRRQEEKKRKMERLKRMREEEEQRRRAAVERLQLENQKLQEMDEDQRMDYLHQKEEEEEEVRRKREERRLEQELISRQVALLQQQSAFKRGLLLEAGGLQKTQSVSRPWIYSYFALMQLLGLKS